MSQAVLSGFVRDRTSAAVHIAGRKCVRSEHKREGCHTFAWVCLKSVPGARRWKSANHVDLTSTSARRQLLNFAGPDDGNRRVISFRQMVMYPATVAVARWASLQKYKASRKPLVVLSVLQSMSSCPTRDSPALLGTETFHHI